ncbi:MAG TPA: 5-formyltetrahydrofolate cyclo-ligase [Mycobacteriales bacterium]|jgi:5-formyltetrahydrofolate cyclo-ligase|nr:5-formyltetrahydrofolate cyclo-ligase [Mycobacteriales bacterium]
MDAKRLLRSRLIAARAARPAAEITRARTLLADHGVAIAAGFSRVAAFAGVGTEPPTRELLDRLRSAGLTVLLPIVAEPVLHWATYTGWDDLVPAPFGLLQPPEPYEPPDALATVDLVLAPALAVDLQGNRLGWGKGYFDRALADIEPQRVVAVVFDDEVLDEVPVQPHDRKVGAALTPDGLRRLDG